MSKPVICIQQVLPFKESLHLCHELLIVFDYAFFRTEWFIDQDMYQLSIVAHLHVELWFYFLEKADLSGYRGKPVFLLDIGFQVFHCFLYNAEGLFRQVQDRKRNSMNSTH